MVTVLLGLCVLAACSPARREVDNDIIRRVKFEGNGGLWSGHNDYQLRVPIEQSGSPPFALTFPFTYFITPQTLSLDTLQADARRLEVWYAHKGWFDARFLGWQVRRVRASGDKRAGVVDLFGVVDPGAQSLVSSLSFEGLEARSTRILGATARSGSTVLVGDPFDLATVRETETHLLDLLRNHSYAYAQVDTTIDAWPEREEVDVTLEATPGITALFGEVRVEDAATIDEASIRDVLTFDAGDPYRIDALRKSQQALFETSLFSLVDLSPDLSDPTSDAVPITVRVTESKFRRFRLSGGVEYDSGTWSPTVSSSWRDVNTFGTKLVTEADVGAGLVVNSDDALVDLLDPSNIQYNFDLSLRYPWLLHRKLPISLSGGWEQEIQFSTLPIQQATAALSVGYRISRQMTLSVGPSFQYFRFLDTGEQTIQAARSLFGGGFIDRFASDERIHYQLFSLDALFLADFRDDPLQPRRGSYWSLDLRQSIPVTSTDFSYGRLRAEVRGYRPVRFKKGVTPKLVLGGRGRVIALGQWDVNDADGGNGLPWPDKAFLGGPNSMRGYKADQMGHYNGVCLYDPSRPIPAHNNGDSYTLRQLYLPVGGVFGAEIVTEARVDWRYGLSFAGWGEIGMLMNTWTDFKAFSQIGSSTEKLDLGIRYGGGVGVRYDTPIGPLRIDLGFRPLFAEDAGPQRHYGCNTLDRQSRAYDLFSSGWKARSGLKGHPDLAMNLFIAIGEAF